MDNKKNTKNQPAEKVICIPDADPSATGKDSPITRNPNELEWVKHPPRRKPGQ